ncbi:MAG: nucleotidyltransferase domain-containing protein [Candidatus Pacearchaeota archaeon]
MAKKRAVKKAKVSFRKIEASPERDIAMKFAVKAQEKFDKILKASILFGSQAKGTSAAKSDIDIVLLIDDASIEWDLELIAWYREELGKIIASKQTNREVHVTTIKLTTWWQDLIRGDPVVMNILRYGEPLIDIGGFFTPLKALLLQGKMQSTIEAVYTALQRAPTHLARSKVSEMGALEGIYWAMIDSAQAALIMAGKTPPSPEHIPEMLQEAFVDKGMLGKGYARAVRDIYTLHKNIAHGKVYDIKGFEIDQWQEVANKFLSEMVRLVDTLIEEKK